MEFKKFPSLENTYRQKEIDQALMVAQHYKENGAEVSWIVTEKVHGSNFSFHINKDEEGSVQVKVGKRTGFIEGGEKFFNYRPVVDKYINQFKGLFNHLNAETLVVYGELFGGNIQNCMSYPLEQDFIAFDVVVDGIAQNKIAMFKTLKSFGIPTVPVLGIFDALADALGCEESFDSLLTRTSFDGNADHKEAEGIVIEPTIPMYSANGSRVYLKKKTKRFLEKSGKPTVKHKSPVVLSDTVRENLDIASQYITEGRFQSVISKIGEVSIKDIGKITGLMTQDILVDMCKDLDVYIDEIFSDTDEKMFKKQLMRNVQDLIKPLLLSM